MSLKHIKWKRAWLYWFTPMFISFQEKVSWADRKNRSTLPPQPASESFTKEDEMLASTGTPFVSTSTTAALCYCACVTDEDWSFVNSQIGFQVLSLITLWFYWWGTTDCFPSIYLAGHSLCFECHLSPFFRKAIEGQIKWGKMHQPGQISHATSCSNVPLKQCKIKGKNGRADSTPLAGHTQNAPRGVPDMNQAE